jgi:hypothetical protein
MILLYFNINDQSFAENPVDEHPSVVIVGMHILYFLIVYVPLNHK